ncbi:hypothetical protein XA68_10455 [Ophiocordyceps unilateralis]|uniref:Uncharacterized protein n=1 Tax=Ophiocordyceps unilateralis TaxID=268505 RepID=A0A2A9PIP0_OPHUN|nr:hypothetical protein XA68_10455 [Ophiocordyceps unilateralis]
MRLLPSFFTVLAASILGAYAKTIIPMVCHSRGFSGKLWDWSVTINLTGEDVTWTSRGSWVTGIKSLEQYVCMVKGDQVRDEHDDKGTPARHELRLLCKQWEQDGWSDYKKPLKVIVGGGQPLQAKDEKGKHVGLRHFFQGDYFAHYCVVDDLVNVA